MGSALRTPALAEPKKSAAQRPRLREATLDDHSQIAALESRYGLSAKNYEEWTHIHLDHPLQPADQRVWPIGWVIENENKEIVGSVGNVPLAYEFEGRKLLAVSGRALVVEPAYRSAALLLLDCLMNQRGVELFVTNAITPSSTPAFDAMGCLRVPVGEWDKSAFWITHRQGFLASLLSQKNIPCARPLSYPLAAAAYLKDAFSTTAPRAGDFEVQPCKNFDDRFDDFWEALKSRNPHLLLAVRSREVLAWHFKYALLSNRLWIGAVADGPRLAAYAIFDRRDNPAFGLRRVRLVDFQSLDGTTALVAPLVSWALKKCRHENIHMLENVGRWMEEGELVRRMAPYTRRLSTWTCVYRAADPALADKLRDRRVWSPTQFDATSSL